MEAAAPQRPPRPHRRHPSDSPPDSSDSPPREDSAPPANAGDAPPPPRKKLVRTAFLSEREPPGLPEPPDPPDPPEALDSSNEMPTPEPQPEPARPPLEKMTIRINRDAADERAQVPKLTIKLGRGSPLAFEDAEGALKMTIKLPKEPPAETTRPRSPERPVVPKLTIKIPPESGEARSPRSPVPKLTIRPIAKPEDAEARRSPARIHQVVRSPRPHPHPDEPTDAVSTKMIFKMRPPSDEHPSSPSRHGSYRVFPASNESDPPPEADVRPEPDRPSKSEVLDRIFELVHDVAPRTTARVVPEDASRPLEIETSPYRCSGPSESGQESPRIILKINKTFQGSTTEILTDKTPRRPNAEGPKDDVELANAAEPLVPKLTIKIPPESVENDSAAGRETNENDSSNLPSPLGRIKLKLTKDGRTKIVDDDRDSASDATKDSFDRTPKVNLKRAYADEDPPNATDGRSKVEDSGIEAKRLKFDKLLANSNITITRVAKPKSALEDLLSLENKPELTVSLVSVNSDKEKISPAANRIHNTRITSNISKSNIHLNDSMCEFPDFLNNIRIKRNEKTADRRKYKRNLRIIKNKIEEAEMDSNAVSSIHNNIENDLVHIEPRNPVFDDTGDIIALNEGSSSQECMIIDDLSQDPLDIDSIAKSHFVPVTSDVVMNNNIVNIIANAANMLTSKPRRGRGRPRKCRLDPSPNSSMVTSTVDERTLRNSKRSREPAITRTPRGRGRGRGRRGALQNSHDISSVGKQNSFFSNSTLFKDIDDTSVTLKESESEKNKSMAIEESIVLDESEDGSDESDVSSVVMSPVNNSINEGHSSSFLRGRARGRGVRGGRRGARGGRGMRSGRGSRGGSRSLRLPKCSEEIQLQVVIPLKDIKNDKRHKSKLSTPSVQLFEEETCMMGDNDASLKDTALLEEESQITELIPFPDVDRSKKSLPVELYNDGSKDWTAADVAEYDWPPEGCSTESPPQTYMIQEQVSLYLGIKSFKRKYPDLHRRNLEPEEKAFLKERGLVSEEMCDLGVTAVDAGEVLDIMFTDFPGKYEEYRTYLRENRDNRASNKPPAHLATERSKQETLERARESASSWNARLNRLRRTARSSAMDLQTLTLHSPRKPQPVAPYSIPSYYPVSLLPGQYTDYYKSYTPEELKYFPLNTVLNITSSPPKVDEGESLSEESAEESDLVDSSSDESGSESSERNFKRKNVNPKSKKSAVDTNSVGVSRPTSPTTANHAQTSVPPTPVEVPRCKLCSGTEHANRRYPSETFITCATCHKKVHPSCLEMAPNVAKCVRLYAWQCADCKCCAQCQDLADDDKMLFCDLCDRGYHIYCVGLKRVPTGRWHCSHCAVCRSCGARTPAGIPGAQPSQTPGPPDQWHHHLKKISSGQKVYSHTLCGPCARAWRAGRYCSLCERCFMGKKGALKVVICVNCDKTHHKECVRQPGRALDVLNYMCNSCRRGNTPRRHFPTKKFTATPKKPPPLSNSSAADSSKCKINNHSQREAVSSMDVSVDSICTMDSNHQSNSTSCDGVFDDTNSAKHTAVNEVMIVDKDYSVDAIDGKQSEEVNLEESSNKIEISSNMNISNNHVEERNDSILAKNDKNINNSSNSVNSAEEGLDENKCFSSDVCKNLDIFENKTLNISQVSTNDSDSVHHKIINSETNSVNVCNNDDSKCESNSESSDLIQTENEFQKNAIDNLIDLKVNFDNLSDNT